MMTSSLEIRRFRRSTDLTLVVDLWRTAFAPEWPVLPAGLDLMHEGYVAERNGRMVGMVALSADGGASIPFIAVAADERRRGTGTQLLDRALRRLSEMAVADTVTAGSGTRTYIWPGVPLDRRDAVAFFDSLGWHADYEATDLIADLRCDGLDGQLARFVPPSDVSIGVARRDQQEAVLRFEEAEFPDWSRWFREPGRDVVVAVDQDGEIVGTLLIAGPGPVTVYWPMLGKDAATIGCVGTAQRRQSEGIGSAMVAAASRVLAERGAGVCHIGWTVRVDFYQRIGFQPWRSYSMRTANLPTSFAARGR